jgi:iron complex transport system substrate-binding protein
MRRIAWVAALAITLAACSGSAGTETTGDTVAGTSSETTSPPTTVVAAETTFPVTVSATNGEVTIEERPETIVSISPTGTEMLFAVGAGEQVVAVDEYSYFPAEAPVTDLSGFTPNVEAIAAFDPDLVVVSDDIDGVVGALTGLGIPTLQLAGFEVGALDDVYRQIETIGVATGHPQEAAELTAAMRAEVESLLAGIDPTDTPLTYYHELDSTFYTVTSSTFIGYLYSLFGLENIADPADADGQAFGYPQLSEEFILEADPDFIFITDCCGDSAATVAARPGWSELSAVRSQTVVVFDDDVSSRWGPRIVEFLRGISRAIDEKNPT